MYYLRAFIVVSQDLHCLLQCLHGFLVCPLKSMCIPSFGCCTKCLCANLIVLDDSKLSIRRGQVSIMSNSIYKCTVEFKRLLLIMQFTSFVCDRSPYIFMHVHTRCQDKTKR